MDERSQHEEYLRWHRRAWGYTGVAWMALAVVWILATLMAAQCSVKPPESPTMTKPPEVGSIEMKIGSK